MGTGERTDPFRSFYFQLEIDGIASGGFSECSGLTADGDAVDYREGTDFQPNVRKLTGLRKYGPITLKRGVTPNKDSVGLVPQHSQRDSRSAQCNGHFAERAASAGAALACRKRLAQQDRSPELQGQRQRSGDGIRGDRPRGLNHRNDVMGDMSHAGVSNSRCLLRAC